jgi:hypothetical protein
LASTADLIEPRGVLATVKTASAPPTAVAFGQY